MTTLTLERPQELTQNELLPTSLEELGEKYQALIEEFGRSTVTYLLNMGEKAATAWQICLQMAKEENLKRYTRKAQQMFAEWKKQFGGNLAQVALDFRVWYLEAPESLQKDIHDINQWSRSVLHKLTKIPLSVAQHIIKEGKNGVRYTVKSIKCLFGGCGQKYLELGVRATEQNWQLIQSKIKKVTEENLPSIRKLASRLAIEANRPICEFTGQIEPYTDDLVAALDKLEYPTTPLMKPEPKKYTESYVGALHTRIQELEQQLNNQQTHRQQQVDLTTELTTQRLDTLEKELTLDQPASLDHKSDTEIDTKPIAPSEKEPWQPATKFSQNAVVAVVKDAQIIAYGQMLRQVGELISVRLRDGQVNLYKLSELKIKMVKVSDKNKKQKIKRAKNKGFG